MTEGSLENGQRYLSCLGPGIASELSLLFKSARSLLNQLCPLLLWRNP